MTERLDANVLAVLEELREDKNYARYANVALSAFKESGILRLLRELGRTSAVPANHENSLTAQAFEAQRSIGYNQALDDILYFRERFLKNQDTPRTVPLQYGAAEAALLKGDLTKEELDVINSGTDPLTIYESFYKSADAASRPATGT